MEAREIDKCIDQFGTDVYRFCLKLCMNQSDAEDLYQQTFLKALEADWVMDWNRNPRSLFFSLAHNLWKSSVRKNARRSSIAPMDGLEENMEHLLHSDENIEENYIRKEMHTVVNMIIENLPDKFRIPITLYYLFDFPLEHVAHIINKPPGTVKSRLFKGRSLIKKRLEESGYEG